MTLIKNTFNRRSFLKASALAGGGMMLGFNWLASCTPANKEQPLQMPEEWFDINAYLKIGDNGVVTIMSPNPEIGQNVKTSMPMIVAEELDVAWKDVIVEQAALRTDQYGPQFAGGSLSIKRNWGPLRRAGATARKMLMEAAAQQWGVPAAELTTNEGVISHQKSGQSIGYGEVATAAAQLEVPEEVELKDPKDFKIIGTSRKNVDAKKIVTGEPLFGLDVKKEGMMIAMIEHAPAFGMKIKSVDDAAARSMPGIHDIITIETLPDGNESRWARTTAFPDLVAVVGRSTWEVMKAKRALKIEWEATSQGENSDSHEDQMAAALMGRSKKPARNDGNIDKAFASAEQIIEKTYSAPFMAHNTMEPMNFYADVTADKAELEGPIQTPEGMRNRVAELLGMNKEKVNVMMTRQGGGFGRRLYGNFGVEAALISQKIQKPVKLVYTREDDMTQGVYRPAYRVTYRAGLDAEGNLLGMHIKGTGIHGSPIFAHRFPAGALDNYQAENFNVDSNISTGAWRAPRSHFTAYAEQSFLDEIAKAAGKDPIDFRLELFDKAKNNPVGEEFDYDPERYAGVLKLVREMANWGEDTPGVYRGVSAYFCHSTYVAQVVDVVLKDQEPVVQKVWCAVDCGIVVNPDAARNQIEGGIVDGIGHCMYSGLTFRDGKPDQNNFHSYRMIRHGEAPLEIETQFVQNGIDPTGLGEPSLPPIQGALANALAKATGQRVYSMPFSKSMQVNPAVTG